MKVALPSSSDQATKFGNLASVFGMCSRLTPQLPLIDCAT